jgi:hypothetical protein
MTLGHGIRVVTQMSATKAEKKAGNGEKTTGFLGVHPFEMTP